MIRNIIAKFIKNNGLYIIKNICASSIPAHAQFYASKQTKPKNSLIDQLKI